MTNHGLLLVGIHLQDVYTEETAVEQVTRYDPDTNRPFEATHKIVKRTLFRRGLPDLIADPRCDWWAERQTAFAITLQKTELKLFTPRPLGDTETSQLLKWGVLGIEIARVGPHDQSDTWLREFRMQVITDAFRATQAAVCATFTNSANIRFFLMDHSYGSKQIW